MQTFLLHSRPHQPALPRGVIGNTTDFGSVILGSSPSGVAASSGKELSLRFRWLSETARVSLAGLRVVGAGFLLLGVRLWWVSASS